MPIVARRAQVFRNFTRIGDRVIEVVKHSIYGWMWSPHSLEEFARVIDEIAWQSPGGWRGHADIEWRLDSAAVRHIKKSGDSDPDEKRLVAYETDLLARTRMEGLGIRDGHRLSDLELLARLQHHGAATRLFDFTRSVYVALWFCTRRQPNSYGLLIGLDLRDAWRLVDPSALEWPMKQILEKTHNGIGVWHPSALSPRIPAQSGFFLWSRAVNRPWGTIGPSPLRDNPDERPVSRNLPTFVCIAVSPALKASMELQAESMFGFNSETLFPDFDGFASAHAVSAPTSF